MEISEVKVKLMRDRTDRLKAFCSVTIDREFVIRDLKIIEGTRGMFVAMPSRKITDKCLTCGAKNHLRAKFCNECGGRLNEDRASKDVEGRAKLHADIAHPINSGCRDRMQEKIVEAYSEELDRSKEPGYRPSFEEDFDVEFHEPAPRAAAPESPPQAEVPSPPPAEAPSPPPAELESRQGEDSFGAGIF